jgi:twitching motility two-component system response regulator PilH
MVIRVLFADQSAAIQKLAARAFAREKIEVIKVGNGDLAKWLLDEINPALVIADVSLPDTDGYELCHFIKHNPRLSHIPVLLLHWSEETLDQARADAALADAYLKKPFESQTLIDAARELLEREGRGADVSPPLQDSPHLKGGSTESVEPPMIFGVYEQMDLDSSPQEPGPEPEASITVEESPAIPDDVFGHGPALEPTANEEAYVAMAAPANAELPQAISPPVESGQASAIDSAGITLKKQPPIKSPLAWAVLAIIVLSAILGIWQATRTRETRPAVAQDAATPPEEKQSQAGQASGPDTPPAPPPRSEPSGGKASARRAAGEHDRPPNPRSLARRANPETSFSPPGSGPAANWYEARRSNNKGANSNRSYGLSGRAPTQNRPAEFNKVTATLPKNERPEQPPVRIIPPEAAGAAGNVKARPAPRQEVKPANGFKQIGNGVRDAAVWTGKKTGRGIKAIARVIKRAFKRGPRPD